MKANKTLAACLPLILMFTACVEKYEPVSKTQRAEEIYRVWLEDFTEYNTCYLSTLFWLDGMLQLTQQQRDSVLQENFENNSEVLKIHTDGACEIRWGYLFGNDYGDYTMKSRMLVKTGGKSLENIGTKWEVILNLPEDYLYPTPDSTTQSGPRNVPPAPQELGFSFYPDYIPFTIECIDNNKWSLQNLDDTTTHQSFSVNYTMEQITPASHVEIFMNDQVRLNGKGRLLAKTGITLDYELHDYILQRNTLGIAGTVALTATETATGTQVHTHVTCHKTYCDITYRDITTRHYY